MKQFFKRIHNFLLPDLGHYRYAPYMWLIYLSLFFFSLYKFQRIEHGYIFATLGTLIFLVLYFNTYWVSGKRVWWNISAILIIGTLMTLITTGASVFFIYAAAFCCHIGNSKKAFIGLAFIIFWIVLISIIFNFTPYFYVPAALFSLMIGGINIFQHNIDLKNKALVLSQNEVKHLARTSERERIARDLHDLIGHTFSVITLKAELAGKLLDKDREKTRSEIKELEQISREALKQVREVVTGYRTSDLNTELAHAKYVLESNDIQFKFRFDDIQMSETINKELAIMLKELITNILKHSSAGLVTTNIKQKDNIAELKVSDDGVGFSPSKSNGNGLKGIQERTLNLGGSYNLEHQPNTTITISIPLNEPSND
ncbi:MAG: sensor histidine kinase [Marinicellaceae bacterium]